MYIQPDRNELQRTHKLNDTLSHKA